MTLTRREYDITTGEERVVEMTPQEEAAFLSAAPGLTLDDYSTVMREYMDTVAQQRGYDSALSVLSYVASTNLAWAQEARAFAAWRDQAFGYAYQQFDAFKSGAIPQPTIAQFLAGLPAITW
jgi:hypothetical protein